MAEGRKRKNLLIVYVSDEEKKHIENKMTKYGTKNFSDYARKMLLDGYIVQKDLSVLKELTNQLGRLSISINQIAKRVNETQNLYKDDIEDLQKYYAEAKKQMVKVIKKEME